MLITSSRMAYEYLKGRFRFESEEFWGLALSSSKRVLADQMFFRGTVDRCPFHPRDIFRFACKVNASCLLVAHNHPNGESFPSSEDMKITRQLVSASKMMSIPVLDHLIITKHGYLSFADEGFLKTSEENQLADLGEVITSSLPLE